MVALNTSTAIPGTKAIAPAAPAAIPAYVPPASTAPVIPTAKAAAPASTNVPPPLGVKPGSLQDPSIVDYLGSIGVDSSMPSLAALGTKAGVVSDPSQYTGTADQNTALLKILRAGQGSSTGNSGSSNSSSQGGSALGGAINGALGGGASGGAGSSSSSSSSGAPASKTSPTGTGAVTTDAHTDPTTGAFDSGSYTAAATKDAKDNLTSVLATNTNNYNQGKTDLQTQMDQWTQNWQQEKDYAMQQAAQYGGSYATEVGEHYDQLAANQQQSFQNALGDLNTSKQNADQQAQSTFAGDQETIASNVANMGMSQEQFDATQQTAAEKNYTSLSTTYNYTPTDDQTTALTSAGITQGMDPSTLQSNASVSAANPLGLTKAGMTLYNMAPDLFDAGSAAGKSFADVAGDFLSGTYKAQAAQLAAQKVADTEANAQATQTRLLGSLANTESYDQSRESYYNTLGAKAVAAPILGSAGLGGITAKALSALAQITAAKGFVPNAATALGTLDAYTQSATGGKPTEAQLENILGGSAYVDRFNALVTKLKGSGQGGVIDPEIASELDALTTQIAQQRVNQYDISRQGAIAAGEKQGYGDSVSNFLPDYKGQLSQYLAGTSNPSADLNDSEAAPSSGTSNLSSLPSAVTSAGITVYQNADGSITDAQGNQYDANGNAI